MTGREVSAEEAYRLGLVNKVVLDLPITYRGVVYPWQCDPMGHMNVRIEKGAAIVVLCRGKVDA